MQHHGQVLPVGLAKADARVQDDLLPADSRRPGDGQRLPQVIANIVHKIAVLRCISVVHQAAGHLVLGDQLRHPLVIFQAPDVVDHVGPSLQRCLYHRTLVAVYGDGDIKVFLDHLNGGHHPVDLLLNTDLLMAGAGGFTANIDDGGPVFDHIGGVTLGHFHVRPLAAVGKGVRRHIQNAHNVAVVVHIKNAVSYLHAAEILPFSKL